MKHKLHLMKIYTTFLLVVTPLIGPGFSLHRRGLTPTSALDKQIDHAIDRRQAPSRMRAAQTGTASKAVETIIHQVDHILLVTPDNGRNLVLTLTERLALPLVWPQPGAEWQESTGISFGNVNLEVFHRESPQHQTPRVPRISSLALQPTDLKVALNELRSRGVAHNPPPEPRPAAAGEPLPRWTTVGLKGFGHGLFLIQYVFDMDERRSRFDRILRERGGGPLGVIRVLEVVIAPDRFDEVRAQWTKLLGPRASADELWRVGDGPKIRLVKAEDPRVGNIIVEVKSLSRAAKTLRELKISASRMGRQIRIDPEGISGLRLVLEEQRRQLRSRR